MKDILLYRPSHSTYSGEITEEDFNTYEPCPDRISRQMEAVRLSRVLRRKEMERNALKEKIGRTP